MFFDPVQGPALVEATAPFLPSGRATDLVVAALAWSGHRRDEGRGYS